MLLDVSSLPRTAWYSGPGGSADLAQVVTKLRTSVDVWTNEGLVKVNDSFGFAVAYHSGDRELIWDYPYDFVWFVAGWGDEADRYIANAVRKLRAALRTGRNTLALRLEGGSAFRDPVESRNSDGTFPWGDFPWGGATFVPVGDLFLPCAVSALKQDEDETAAMTIGGFVGTALLRLQHPEILG